MLTVKEIDILLEKYRFMFESRLSLELSDLNLGYQVEISFADKEGCWTNNQIVNLGSKTLYSVGIKDENDFLTKSNFLLSHEIQHIRSTDQKIWDWGIEMGSKKVLEQIAKLNAIKMTFNRDADYDMLISKLKKEKNIVISRASLQDFVHFIINSVCDGRIERIKSILDEGFISEQSIFRGEEWQKNECTATPIEKLSETQKLYIILNQVLTLATMNIYEKGFKKAYAGTEIETEVKSVMKNIFLGTHAKTCKDGMMQSLQIIDKLSKRIAMCVQKESNAFEEMLKKLIADAIKNGLMNNKNSNYGKGESNDSQNLRKDNRPPFGMDIEIEMTQEEYDKLKKDCSTDEDADINIHVIITDKKEEQENQEDSSSSSNQAGEDSKSNSSSNNEGEDNKSNSSSNSEGEDSKSSSDDLHNPSSKDLDNKSEVKNSVEDMLKENTGKESGSQSGACGEYNKNNATSDEDTVKQAMEEAAKQQKGYIDDAKSVIDRKDSQVASPNKRANEKKQGENIKADPSCKGVKNLYNYKIGFNEYARHYLLDKKMPFWLKSKSDTFLRKVKETLLNMYHPAIRCRKSGIVDNGMVHKLAIKDTAVFMKRSITEEFDGCCYILVDNSGSMGYGTNSKRSYAWTSVAEIEAGYSELMPVKIVAFDATSCVNHEIVKDWNEILKNSGAYNFMIQGRGGGGNMDGYSIAIAVDELMRQNGKKKLLIVLSDGAPDDKSKVKTAVEYARKNNVHVVGIYFSEVGTLPSEHERNMFESMYGKGRSTIVTSPENISSELYQAMKKEFL